MSNSEMVLESGDFLVSETDAKGIIKFANEDFCKYAGYTLQELIGKPHNMVRHNDMPKAAFADLWETVKRGGRWKGFVKNARQDGGYYWVYATVYPFTSCDGTQGFISCRKKASEEEVIQYTELYKTMKAGE